MHVTPSELRFLRQDGIQVRFALLGPMAYVLVDLPESGSAGTPIEQSCTKPHWGFVMDGEVTFESAGMSQTIEAGNAFHVPPSEVPHQFRIAGPARVAGFEPIDPDTDVSDDALASRGFLLADGESLGAASIVPAVAPPLLDPGQIDATTWPMSTFVLTQARFGPGSGYLNDWCDAPHWGLVTSGRLAIEWEDDVEVLAAGDIYHCPPGPPGHRFEAADPAGIIELTPIASLAAGSRLAPWRTASIADLPGPEEAHKTIAVAGLG